AILVRAADDLHAVGAMLRHELKHVASLGQVGFEATDFGVEGNENKTVVLGKPGNLFKVHFATLDQTGRHGVASRHVDEMAQVVIGPTVIAAIKGPALALGLAAHQSTAVRAGIEI